MLSHNTQGADSKVPATQAADLTLRKVLNLSPVKRMRLPEGEVEYYWRQKALFDGGRLLYTERLLDLVRVNSQFLI